ncbi:D-alanyl-D-alanine carboxypeptidase family protein [Cellulomonas sp. URHD0024]|uniref:M15 family metallopeptidase n=1 Tax=Cellulomonas sp. URHD0024 TaxID=1302620 RepID=UPI00040EF093|nr:M15 family metallopeptidase [Cellulomonas sp. URHD0024]
MDGIAGIAARMAQIQALVAPPQAAPLTTSTSTFASALADEVAKTTGSTGNVASAAGAARAGASGAPARLNADGVPVELARYGNGRIPESALQKVGGTGERLWAPAAQKLEQLMGAAAKDGVHIGITDSYRSYAAQVDVAQRKGLYSQGGLAAQPGTSEHGWGMAADLKLDAAGQRWMRAHGAEYGFVKDTPRESWHWAFRP